METDEQTVTETSLTIVGQVISYGGDILLEAVSRLNEVYKSSTSDETIITFRRKLYSEGVMYRQHVYPESIQLVEGVMDLLEYYRGLEFRDFGDMLPDIILQCEENAKRANDLQIRHSFVLKNLSELKEEMKRHGDELLATANRLRKEAKAKNTAGAAMGVVSSIALVADVMGGLGFFTATVGLAAPVGAAIAFSDSADDDSRQAGLLHYSVSQIESMCDCLSKFSDAVGTVSELMINLRRDLDVISRFASKRFSEGHWKIMTRKANEIVTSCNGFIGKKDDIEVKMLSISEETESGYEKYWIMGLALESVRF